MPRFTGWLGRALHAIIAGILCLSFVYDAFPAEGDAPSCAPAIGRVVSRQGEVDIRRSGSSEWHHVTRLDTTVCHGDAVRTGVRSRAALWLQPENLIRLDQRTAVTMFASKAETRVEFFSSGQVSADPDCGAAYFISRFPRNFGVTTPFLSAAIKGTEFLVNAQCSSTTLAVFEGAVAAKELESGREFRVGALQQISVGPGLPSSIPIPIKPRDGVQWTIYYPRTFKRRNAGDQAFLEQCAAGIQGADCDLGNVEALLAAGAVAEAEGVIRLLKADGAGGSGLAAIESILAIARDNRQQALTLAVSATEQQPDDVRGWMALSYAKQSLLDLDGALAAALRAAEIAPASSLAKARQAEMLLTVGRFKDAEIAAEAAKSLDPMEPRALQVLGFAQLVRGNAEAARQSLQASLEIDSTDPRTRLGLGLAKIRKRELVEGREDIEIAVALDPTNALARTYLGRAYFEENRAARDDLAREQYRMASALDPEDPTSWFYGGALQQAEGRPVEAIDDLRRSVERNDNRAVYRPRSALDQDAASRSVGVARLYSGLGFEGPAIGEVASALAQDATNYAAQQYLSEASAALPRQQFTRASAGLQAQLRQPIGTDAPLAGLANVASLNPERPYLSSRTIGPERPGYYDFDPLFSGPGFAVRGWGVRGSYGTAAEQITASAAFDRGSLAIGQLHAETDGQRTNNDQSRNSYVGLASFQPSPSTTVQIEAQQSNALFGDLPIRFDPHFLSPDQRNTERSTVGRFGFRQNVSADSEVLGVVTHSEFDFSVISPSGPVIQSTDGSFTSPELQYIGRYRNIQVVAGGSLIEGSRREMLELPAFGLSIPSRSVDRSKTAYAYSTTSLADGRLHVTIGASWDDLLFQSLNYDLERWHPKLGVVWNVDPSTTIRAASFRSIQRPLVAGQTIEPVQIAGFGQYFDDVYGSIARRTAVAIDHRFGDTLYVGFSGGIRRIEATSRFFDANGNPQFVFNPWTEREGGGYVHWMARKDLVLSIQLAREAFERTESNPGIAQFLSLVQWRLPVSAQWFASERVSLYSRLSYLHQQGVFCSRTTNFCDVPGRESSVVTDFGATYRFPRRMGGVSLDVLNAFNERFLYQSLDTSRIAPFTGRAVFGRVFLNF